MWIYWDFGLKGARSRWPAMFKRKEAGRSPEKVSDEGRLAAELKWDTWNSTHGGWWDGGPQKFLKSYCLDPENSSGDGSGQYRNLLPPQPQNQGISETSLD